MAHAAWLDSPEAALAYLRSVRQQKHLTEEDGFKIINEIRDESGDRPLTMKRYLEIGEQTRLGTYSPTTRDSTPMPRHFFQRFCYAWQAGRKAFKAAMRKGR